jgi:hypothetical protein
MLKSHIARPWFFHHHPKLDPLVRLDAHDQAIGGYAVVMHREYDVRQTMESNNDFREALWQPFARAEVEGNSCPSPIGDTELEGHKGFCLAALLADILQIAWDRSAVGKTSAVMAA